MTIATVAGARSMFTSMRQFRADLDAGLATVAQNIAGMLSLSADASGVIPAQNESRVLALAGDTLQRFFVGPDFRQPFASDGVTPQAVYPDLLNRAIASVTISVILKHSQYMKKRLPKDVEIWLQSRMSKEQTIPTYEPAHTWVDPSGYRLSDRIWQTSVRSRAQLDAMLAERIRGGTSATDIAKQAEQFLLPSRAPLRTKKPYGRDASFDAMRLARTEIARAHSETTFEAARANPFTDVMDWALSGRHPRSDICDDLATIDASGARIREPYPLEDAPMPIRDSHPQCICTARGGSSQSVSDVIADLRERMGRHEEPPVTPIDTWRFARRLLGGYLVNQVVNDFRG